MRGQRNHFIRLLVLALLLLVFPALYPQATAGAETAALPAAATYTYKVISSYPHDPDAFTQGLVIENGQIQGWLDLAGLLGREGAGQQVDVLNGIAYDQAKDTLYVTGKLWPRLYAIQPVLVQEK